ncbi:hypothetical protein [Deinococcus hopiensis]|uniref:Uncharacterized protein n=1 Tax=Deinococcus hopiensis KR-140 TaxID=695939 RepID=A0A1W1VSE2_9DEIO|nr:hypothetical protein [Deinococcus hopiensis]SMB95804.1 hypothetical protein SAMN00790413_03005 [Deinococcus hopiensis KR-140]
MVELPHQIDCRQQGPGFKQERADHFPGTGVPGIRSKFALLSKGGQATELYRSVAPKDRKAYPPSPVDAGSWHLALGMTDLYGPGRIGAEWS